MRGKGTKFPFSGFLCSGLLCWFVVRFGVFTFGKITFGIVLFWKSSWHLIFNFSLTGFDKKEVCETLCTNTLVSGLIFTKLLKIIFKLRVPWLQKSKSRLKCPSSLVRKGNPTKLMI